MRNRAEQKSNGGENKVIIIKGKMMILRYFTLREVYSSGVQILK